ncbi:MAG: hypothetical protein JWQ27_2185 [Ferruginibacter sp.]|nr:hypothetical protein [Ferruginibacter sp.]
MKFFLSIFCFLLISVGASAQQDPFCGSWRFDYKKSPDDQPIVMQLMIGQPERNQLYPAMLTLAHRGFSARYELLLVKKKNGQLAIGRNKVPQSEEPFSIGAYTVYLNGTFNLKNKGGKPTLLIERMVSIKYGVPLPALSNYEDEERSIVMSLRDFLKEAPIALKQFKTTPSTEPDADKILSPWTSPAYFGIMDSIHLHDPVGKLNFNDTKKSDNDTVSVRLNNKWLVLENDLSQRTPAEEFRLDTGLNILSFFADNYGTTPPNTGKLNLAFGAERFSISFTNTADISAGFIVAKLYYYPDQHYDSIRLSNERKLMRNTKLIDSLSVSSKEITLAIWDDAVEDGDSISLSLNGNMIVQGFAVKKKPRFLKLTLDPGPNNIIFIADNLGAISPNTAILEIIDDKRRRSFMINTNLGENNRVKILYVNQ